MLTMLAGGLWHGASWTFVIWGGLHGSALIVNHEFQRLFSEARRRVAAGFVGWFLTINFVCAAWIFFRSPDLATSVLILKKYCLLNFDGARTLPGWLIVLPPILLLIQMGLRNYRLVDRFERSRTEVFAFCYGAGWAGALALLPLAYRPFIYFQF